MEKEFIEERKKQLEGIIKDIIGHNDFDVTKISGDEGDKGIAEFINNDRARANESVNRRLQLIENALNKISNETYGLCVLYCDGQIKPERLEITPYVEACFDCQTEYENNLQSPEKPNLYFEAFDKNTFKANLAEDLHREGKRIT